MWWSRYSLHVQSAVDLGGVAHNHQTFTTKDMQTPATTNGPQRRTLASIALAACSMPSPLNDRLTAGKWLMAHRMARWHRALAPHTMLGTAHKAVQQGVPFSLARPCQRP